MLFTIFKFFILQERQYQDVIDKRILSQETIFTTTKRNSLKLFKDSVNPPSQKKSRTSSLKQQHTQILLAMQLGRKISKDLFSHEVVNFLTPQRKMAECIMEGSKKFWIIL